MNTFIFCLLFIVGWWLIGFISLVLLTRLEGFKLFNEHPIKYGDLVFPLGFPFFGLIITVNCFIITMSYLFNFINNYLKKIKDKPITWLDWLNL